MDKERVEILLEQIGSDVKAIAEGHSTLNNKIDRMDNKIDRMDNKIDRMNDKFTIEINDIKTLLKFHSSELKDLNDKVTSIGGKVDSIDTKLDKHILQPSHV